MDPGTEMDAPRRSHGPSSRTESEARALVTLELERLGDRRGTLGEAGIHAVVGWVLQMHYEFEAAALAWSRAHELDPEQVQAVFSEGCCRLELGQLEAAERLFLAAAALDDAHAAAGAGERLDWFEEDPFYRLGNVFHVRGDLERAAAAYTESAERNVGAVEPLIELVRCQLARKRPEAALVAVALLEKRAVRVSVRAEALGYRAEAEAMLRA